MSKEKSIWFAMNLLMDQLEKNKITMEHSSDDSEVEICKHYESFIKEHLANLEDIRRVIVMEEQNENSNKNKQVL